MESGSESATYPSRYSSQYDGYRKIFEDTVCRPREHSVWCGQCLCIHPVHTQEPCILVYVTEDQELANGNKSHLESHSDSLFLDRLETENNAHNQIIHIKYIEIRDGCEFAENTK